MRKKLQKIFLLLAVFSINTQANPLDTLKQEYKDFRTYPRINKAYQLIEKGKENEAKELLQKVLIIDQKNQKAIDALVNICVEQKDKKCIKKYEKKITNANLGYFYKEKAQKVLEKKQYNKAIKYARKALKYDLEEADRKFTHLLLFQSYLHLNQYLNANKLIKKEELSISQTFEWSKISDNLGNAAYASSLAQELPNKEKYLKWNVNLFIKNKNYPEAVKKMEKLYKINPTDKNEKQLTYLYDVTHQKESIVNNYKNKLKKSCNKYALEFLIDHYKNNKKERTKVLEDNYPYSCLSKKKRVNLTLQLIDLLKSSNPKKARNLSGNILKDLENNYQKEANVNNKTRLLNLYESTGDKDKIVHFYKKELLKGCNQTALLYLLNYYKKDKRKKKALLSKNYPYACFPRKKQIDLNFQLLFYIEKSHPTKVKQLLESMQKKEIDYNKYLVVSNIYSGLNMYEKSIDYALAYLKKEPKNLLALKNVGYAYLKLKNKELATHYLLRASKIAPKESTLLKNIGYLGIELKEYQTTADYWERYLQEKSDSDISLELASVYYYQLKKDDDARRVLHTYAEMTPTTSRRYHLLKAKLAYKEADCVSALEHYEKALKIKEDEYTEYAYIHLLKECKQEKDSLDLMQQFVKKYPNKLQYKKELAYMFEKNKNYKELVKSYKEIIKEEPNNFQNETALAYAYKHTKNNKKAKKYFKKAIDNADDIDKKKLTNLKSEIYYGSKNFNVYVAQSLRLDSHKQSNNSLSPVNGATYAGFGDIQFSYRPKFLSTNSEFFAELSHGHRNGEIVQSMQPSIGIRYKPLKNHNVILSAQQLIKRSDSTRNDTLLRAAIGISSSPQSTLEHTAYVDSAYFTRANSVTLYSNYEVGKTYKINKNVDVKPYLTTGGTYSNDNMEKESVTKLDVGLGVAVSLIPDETKYELPQYKNRLKLEARKQYAGNAKDDQTLRLQWEFFY